MTTNTPTLSVVIPVKNRKESLLRALASVKKQTYAVAEIIVVDDGSDEVLHTHLAGNYPGVIWLRNDESKGAPYARNRGWKYATSELIAFLDSDDEMKPECLANKVHKLVTDNLDLVVGSFCIEQQNIVKPFTFNAKPPVPLRDHLLLNTPFDARTSTFVMKRSVLEKISFDEKLKKHQDWDLFINVDYSYETGFTNDNDVILHISENDRISATLKHDSTQYFMEKNKHKVSGDALFLFTLKMFYKSFIRNDETGMACYRNQVIYASSQISLKHKIIALLMRLNLVNVSLLHFLKRIF